MILSKYLPKSQRVGSLGVLGIQKDINRLIVPFIEISYVFVLLFTYLK